MGLGGVRELRTGRGGQGSEVIAAAFLDKGATSPSLPMDADVESFCDATVWTMTPTQRPH